LLNAHLLHNEPKLIKYFLKFTSTIKLRLDAFNLLGRHTHRAFFPAGPSLPYIIRPALNISAILVFSPIILFAELPASSSIKGYELLYSGLLALL
jgi:hypothetical protein